MSVKILDANLEQFLRSTNGPVGRDLARRAFDVSELARLNASGAVIGIDTGDLLSGIHTRVLSDAKGLYATVSTPARHRGFAYPAFHDRRGRPWLTKALAEGFR